MTKAPTTTENPKKQRVNTKKRHQNFDYATISDGLRTVSWSNNSHPTGVVKPVYERSTYIAFNSFCRGLQGFAGFRECPPWCSIVGATVTVHQYFCILHFTRNVGELAELYRRLSCKLEVVPSLGFESYLRQDFFCNVHLFCVPFRIPLSWTGSVQMKSSMTFIRGNNAERERERESVRERERERERFLKMAAT